MTRGILLASAAVGLIALACAGWHAPGPARSGGGLVLVLLLAMAATHGGALLALDRRWRRGRDTVSLGSGARVGWAGVALLVTTAMLAGLSGLVDGLEGAQRGLAAAGDASAVRQALTAPLIGLADGLTAAGAGLLAAVVLGLATAAVARSEVVARPAAEVSVPSPAIVALETLARDSAALPAAAAALARAAERIAALEAQLATAHVRTTEDVLGLVRGAVGDFRADLKGAVEDAARVSKEAVTPLAEEAVQRVAEAIAGEQSKIVELLARDFEKRRSADLQHAAAVGAHGTALIDRLADVEAERAKRLDEHVQALSLHTAAAARAAETRDAEQVARLDRTVERMFERIEQGDEARLARQEAALRSHRAGFDAALAALRSTFDEQSASLAARLEESADRVREAAALVEAGGAEMSGVAELFGEAVDRHREAASGWLESLGEVEAAVDRAGRTAAADALRDQLAATQAVFARQLQLEQEMFEQLRALRTGDGTPGATETGAAAGV